MSIISRGRCVCCILSLGSSILEYPIAGGKISEHRKNYIENHSCRLPPEPKRRETIVPANPNRRPRPILFASRFESFAPLNGMHIALLVSQPLAVHHMLRNITHEYPVARVVIPPGH
jgi:hypothetical protein